MSEVVDHTNELNVIEEEERDNCSLFLGDLSIFCDEKDIEEAFAQFGEIVDIRIQRSKETSRALSYGFIEFADPACAEAALNNMNYYLLKGRPLRIRWAASRKNPIKSAATPHDSAATVYVRFMSQTPDAIVSEESLRELFNNYGPVFDCAIKKLSQDAKTHRIKGYAFVSFDSGVLIHGGVDVAGVDSAYRAAQDLRNRVVGNVRYRCELGYRLHKTYAAMGQQAMYMTDAAVPIAMPVPVAVLPPPIATQPPMPPTTAVPVYDQSYNNAAYGAHYAKPEQQHHNNMPQQQQAPQQAYPTYQQTMYAAPQYQQYTAPPQQQQQQQAVPVQQAPQAAQQPAPHQQQQQYENTVPQYAYQMYPQYQMHSTSFSPTHMVSQILSSNRSPTNYELQMLQALQAMTPTVTPRNAYMPQQAQQPAPMPQGQYGNAYQPTQVQQHQGYASAVPARGGSPPMQQGPMPAQQLQQQYRAQATGQQVPMHTAAPTMQFVQMPQYGYYVSQVPGVSPYGTPHSTPTHAHPEGGLRSRTTSSDASGMSYGHMMPTASMVMSVPMSAMSLTSGGMPQVPPINTSRTYTAPPYQHQQGQMPQQQTVQQQAVTPRTPHGSCSEYFSQVKGLDLRVSTAPVPHSQEPVILVHQLTGSRDSTPRNVYNTRKVTPAARKTMHDVRAQQQLQQTQVHEQMQASPDMCKSPSRRGSADSAVTTSLFATVPESASVDEADVGGLKGVHSASTEVMMATVSELDDA